MSFPNLSVSHTYPPRAPRLPNGGVHIWTWDAEHFFPLAEGRLAALDDDERMRASRFRFDRDRMRFLISHFNMRLILSKYLLRAPQEIMYEKNQFGKPSLGAHGAGPELHFNMSHSQGLGILAVSNLTLGVDAELERPIREEIASAACSSYELRQLERLSGRRWLEAFYLCWTCKEAVLKAEGTGLSIPLDVLDIDFMDETKPYVAAFRFPGPCRPIWRLFALQSATGVTTSLAVSDVPASLSYYQLTDYEF